MNDYNQVCCNIRYVYYARGISAPFFEDISNEKNVVSIHNVIKYDPSCSSLEKTSPFYKLVTGKYIEFWAHHFKSVKYKATEEEYYNFFKTLSDKKSLNSRGNTNRCGNQSRIVDSNIIINNDNHEPIVKAQSDPVLDNDKYCIRAPLTYTSNRILGLKTLWCVAGPNTGYFEGYIDSSILYYINIKAIDKISTGKNMICNVRKFKEPKLNVYLNSFGDFMAKNMHYLPEEDGYPSTSLYADMSTSNILDIIEDTSSAVEKHYRENISNWKEKITTARVEEKKLPGIVSLVDTAKTLTDQLYL